MDYNAKISEIESKIPSIIGIWYMINIKNLFKLIENRQKVIQNNNIDCTG